MKKQSSDLVTEAEFFFPEELVSEILSWLEVKYLLRYKSVCKSWYALINNKRFAGLHSTRDGCRSFHYINVKSIDINDGIERTRLLDCAPMGLCLVEQSSLAASDDDIPSAIYRIITPSTKRVLDLPHNPCKRVCFMMLFRSSSTNSYYAFSIYLDEKDELKSGLLDLGGQSSDPCPNANLSWKTSSISEFHRHLRRGKIALDIENNDILYFLVLGKVRLSNPKISCYDLVKQQTCTTPKVPHQTLGLNLTTIRFSNWRGRPAVSVVSEEKVNIRVLEDYKQQKWAEMIQIPLPSPKEYSSWNELQSYEYCTDRQGWP